VRTRHLPETDAWRAICRLIDDVRNLCESGQWAGVRLIHLDDCAEELPEDDQRAIH